MIDINRNPGSTVLPVLFLLAITVLVTSCFGGSSSHITTTPKPLTGIVQIPAGSPLAARQSSSVFAKISKFFFADSRADITGLAPLTNATIQLVRIDSLGNVTAVIATTTSDAATGAYTFANPPPLDSTLMVRVDPAWITANAPAEPNPDQFRAIASRSDLDITPQSESVVAMVYNNLTGGKVIGNYDNAEITSLYNLVGTLNVDVSAATTFADSVATVTTAATPVISDMATAFASAARAAFPDINIYSSVGMSTTLMDPFALLPAVAAGGFASEQSSGGYGFDSAGIITGGLISGMGLRQNFDTSTGFGGTVTSGNDIQIDPSGQEFVVASNGQLAVTTDSATAVAGFDTRPDNSLLAYLVDSTSPVAGQWLRTGMRLAVRSPDVPPLDSFFSGSYNLVSFENRMFGPVSTAGAARVEAVTGIGTYTFDTPPVNGSGTGHTTPGSADALGQALKLPYLVTNAATTITAPANFKKAGLNSVQFNDASGTFVGIAQITPDGQIMAYYTARDVFQHEINVLANDTDAVGDTLQITTINAQPTNGGSAQVDSTGGLVLYTPPGDSTSPEQFTYSISDGALSDSNSIASVSVSPIANVAPNAVDDTYDVNVGSTNVVLDVLENDQDAVDDVLTISNVSAAASGTVTTDGKTITYSAPATPVADSFTYTITDGTLSSTAATVNVNVVTNAAPVANGDTFNVNVGSGIQVLKVLANDTDAAGDNLTISNLSLTASGTSVASSDGKTISYTAPATPVADSFTYTITDGTLSSTAATVNINVAANAAPVANDDGFSPDPIIQVNNNNAGGRGLTLGIRLPASAIDNTVVTGTYNAIEIATALSEVSGNTTGLIDSEYRYGTITFDGAGGVTGGSLVTKRNELDIATAQSASAPALQSISASSIPDTVTPAGNSYTVNPDGTVDATLVIGTQIVTGTGAVTEDGRFLALTVRSDDLGPPVQGMRGLLLLSKQ